MTFKELLVQDALDMFDTSEFAEAVTYNGASIVAIVEIGQAQASGNMFTNYGVADRAIIHVLTIDVPKVVSGDEIEARGTTWSVVRVLESNSAVHTLGCTAHERVEW